MRVRSYAVATVLLTAMACNFSGSAFADEVTTTTTRTNEQIKRDHDDCMKRSMSRTNENTGTTVTRTQTKCD
jgi:hypothetical protein